MEKRINIFTYGTLMFEPVMNPLVTEKYVSKKATLKDYRRRQLINQRYPGIIHYPGEQVEGLLYYNINSKDTQRLDEFEYEYTRDPVTVQLQDGSKVQAFVYVIKNKLRMSDQPWDPEKFREAYSHIFAGEHSATIPK